jgi:hypothetical protein
MNRTGSGVRRLRGRGLLDKVRGNIDDVTGAYERRG